MANKKFNIQVISEPINDTQMIMLGLAVILGNLPGINEAFVKGFIARGGARIVEEPEGEGQPERAQE